MDKIELLADEEWKEIRGYEGRYWISNMGRVLSKRGRNYKLLKPIMNWGGYLSVNLCKNYSRKQVLIHRIVVSHFIKEYNQVLNATNHKNNIRTDNRASNLEICDYSYNNKYAYSYGFKRPVMMLGSKNPSSVAVIQLDLEGKFICEFICMKYAKLSLNLKAPLRVYKIGKKICANKGWVFMMKNEYNKIKKEDGSVELPKFRRYNGEKRIIINTKQLRKIVQLSVDDNLIKVFDNYKIAEKEIGKKGVLDVCRNRIFKDKQGYIHQPKTCGGFKWMYYDEYIKKIPN